MTSCARALVFALALFLFALPAAAQPSFDEELADILELVFNGLEGNDIDMTVGFDITPPFVPAIHIEVEFLGFAFCTPTDPWAEPIVAVPPANIYGCLNVATVTADVTPDETSAEVVIGVNPIYLDLETRRDTSAFCGEANPFGTIIRDGYVIMDGSITTTLQLERVGGCVQATLVPGSVEVDLSVIEKGSQDQCLLLGWDLVEPLLVPAVEEGLSTAVESATELLMDFNDLLCTATPSGVVSWGAVKGGLSALVVALSLFSQ